VLDVAGAERYGHVQEGTDFNAAMGAGTLEVELLDGDLFGSRRRTGEMALVAKLLAPVPLPPVIYGIGLNYRQHAIDANLTIPTHPAVFFKNRHSHNDPFAPVVIPKQSSLPDYEGELAIVLGRDCKDATLENALDCVLGYTAANDVSARCWQADTSAAEQCLMQNESYHPKPIGQWSFSKSFDTHCPLGPALVLKSVLGDARGLRLQTHLNGKLMQDDDTSDMIFDIGEKTALSQQLFVCRPRALAYRRF
jgi:2-keto-4-pentenoate hydratase/2-oxohepta-3-ene-1,7-dioic acid hydratase in catechol pathway